MTPQPTPPICAVCKQRPAETGVLIGVRVCLPCFEEAKDDEVRIYRLSLRVVRGGLPR